MTRDANAFELRAEPLPPPEVPDAPPHSPRPARRPWWRRPGLVVGALAAVLAAAGVALRARGEPPVLVRVTPVQRAAIARIVTAAGKLQAATTVRVSSNISGDLVALHVKEGDRVTKGQLLARVDARRYAAQVRQQEAVRASAVAEQTAQRAVIGRLGQELERSRRLGASGNASRAELERAEADLRAELARSEAAAERIAQADASLAEARHLLSFSSISAPIDGIVVARWKQVGERVRGSDLNEDPIVTVATLSAMEAKVEVGEREVVFVHEGDPAEVEIDALPDQRFAGQVIEVAKNATVKNPGTEAEVTTFVVRVGLKAAPRAALPGMSVQATISTETHQGALVVPIQAVTVRAEKDLAAGAVRPSPTPAPADQPAGGGAELGRKPPRERLKTIVFVVDGDVVRVRPAVTGLADESRIEIVSGLQDGERVVEGPYQAVVRLLRDGTRVASEPTSTGQPR